MDRQIPQPVFPAHAAARAVAVFSQTATNTG